MQRRRIISTIASNSNSPANFNKSMNKHEFVIRLGASHNFKLALNLFEFSKITNSALNSYLVFVSALFTLNATVNLATELLSSHANIVLLVIVKISVRKDASFASNSLSSFKIITSNHAHIDTSFVARTYSLSNTRSQRVL